MKEKGSSEGKPELLSEMQHVLSSYSKAHKIPESLMEASLFKKPWFQNEFLPALLTLSNQVPKEIIEFLKTPETDTLRIQLIHQLHFQGKIPEKLYKQFQEQEVDEESISEPNPSLRETPSPQKGAPKEAESKEEGYGEELLQQLSLCLSNLPSAQTHFLKKSPLPSPEETSSLFSHLRLLLARIDRSFRRANFNKGKPPATKPGHPRPLLHYDVRKGRLDLSDLSDFEREVGASLVEGFCNQGAVDLDPFYPFLDLEPPKPDREEFTCSLLWHLNFLFCIESIWSLHRGILSVLWMKIWNPEEKDLLFPQRQMLALFLALVYFREPHFQLVEISYGSHRETLPFTQACTYVPFQQPVLLPHQLLHVCHVFLFALFAVERTLESKPGFLLKQDSSEERDPLLSERGLNHLAQLRERACYIDSLSKKKVHLLWRNFQEETVKFKANLPAVLMGNLPNSFRQWFTFELSLLGSQSDFLSVSNRQGIFLFPFGFPPTKQKEGRAIERKTIRAKICKFNPLKYQQSIGEQLY